MERKKYLHRYLNLEDFEGEYNNDVSEVTAITIDGAYVYTGCGQEASTETHDYDGKYVFDREIENLTVTFCQMEGKTEPYSETFPKARVYKKGNVEIYDFYYCDDPDECSWESDHDEIQLINDLAQAGVAGDAVLYVSGIERGEGKYHEPWVSYTTYSAATQVSGDWWFAQEDGLVSEKDGTAVLKYGGEVDWEPISC